MNVLRENSEEQIYINENYNQINDESFTTHAGGINNNLYNGNVLFKNTVTSREENNNFNTREEKSISNEAFDTNLANIRPL